ncbi:hypothetical protein B484DRAFT_223841 [Ochromonadaceae sp. CCMP2298]|nr:hypothetical protein B484DRAFT_223841 [Ochromonadaceae sp. CCMP2298]
MRKFTCTFEKLSSSLLFKLLLLACILAVSAQRHQPQRRLAEVDIDTLLGRISASLQDAWTTPMPVGYAFWRSDTSGWGNQCRGMSAMLGFALLSGRKLIFTGSPEVPSAVYFDMFDEPSRSYSINAKHYNLSDLNTKGAWGGTGGQLGKPVEAYSAHLQHVLDSNGSVGHQCGCTFAMVLTTQKYANR